MRHIPLSQLAAVFGATLSISTAATETPFEGVRVGTFLNLAGQVVQSVQSGEDFWLRVNITQGDYGR
jgi:hypothetical protein